MVCLGIVRLLVCLLVKEKGSESREAVWVQNMLSTVGMTKTGALLRLRGSHGNVRAEQ